MRNTDSQTPAEPKGILSIVLANAMGTCTARICRLSDLCPMERKQDETQQEQTCREQQRNDG